ncbi:MAG: pyridoxal-phosphate dependent enzyme [Candidatus Eisenbacteria sp.]|nr:pyridoxal-phosphate dependent enzyme [Candidatus Eisenbacteria bacterium]
MKIIGEINEGVLEKTIARCRGRRIIIPTFAQQMDPKKIPAQILKRLKGVGLWDIDPINLFRITWKNEPKSQGGLFNDGNWIEFPSELTGVPARIVGLMGKYFPTGSHKVGAGFGCLVPRLVSGTFDPTSQHAVWPSTGNYCRGGAFDCALLACPAVAILPEEMSQERFEWLREIGTEEIIATPGCESNVKEIYDKCWELKAERGDRIVIFNQFDEFGNAIWHYHATGSIIEEIWTRLAESGDRFTGFVSATGSAGTLAAGDYLKTRFPGMIIVATEALQCPTLLRCGFGGHRIEGIGDKHVPWIHNVRNTDMICAVDDEQTMQLLRLFNEKEGIAFLIRQGVSTDLAAKLPMLGISSICNLIAAIQTAKYYELGSRDWLLTPLTDSMELYGSRVRQMRKMHGPYTAAMAERHFGRYLEGIGTDNMRELGYRDRKTLHNFKYFTWVEQQGRSVDELRELWDPDFWIDVHGQVEEWDELIREFNERTGLLAELGCA